MSNKKRTYGQYETPTDVADLLLGFCLRRPIDHLLDPSCGSGTLLARAARFQSWLGPGAASAATLWGVELDPVAAAEARELLPQAHIICGDFLELYPERDRLFDVLIGNPPYTRAEWIGQLVQTQPSAHQLAMFETRHVPAVQNPMPVEAISDIARRVGKPGILDRRAGLHAHFFVHGTDFLREVGRFGFVVPNSWLDVAYGERLKRYLLEHYKILALIESTVERWFSQARVNTCLTVLERCDDPAARAANRVRLVRLRKPLRQLIPFAVDDRQRVSHLERLTARMLPSRDSQGEDFAARVVVQGKLAAGEKWGVALRAPVVFQKRSREANLHPLKSWATVRRGFTTGANEFFYLDVSTIERWAIEPKFMQPLLKSLRNVDSRRLGSVDQERQVLLIEPEAKLKGTAVSNYISWGESQGFHRRRTCAGRQPWYILPDQLEAPLLLAKGIWERHFSPLLEVSTYVDQQLYQVQLADGISALVAAALFNSSWFALQLELNGRVNLGEGVLWLAAYDLENLLMPDPRYLTSKQLALLSASYEPLLLQPVSTVAEELARPDWQEFNATVFDILGFTREEGDAVTEALLERMATRKLKAGAELR